MNAKTFGSVLEGLRKQKDLTRAELADGIGITTAYLSSLVHKDPAKSKLPSVEVLRKIIEEFDDQDPEAIFDLMVTAAAPDLSEDFIAPRGWISTESILQQKESFLNKWVVTDKIGEAENDNLYRTTVEKLKKGTRYVFFIPFGSFQFEALKTRFEADSELSDVIVRESVMCIAASPIMFFSRLAIWFNEELTATDVVNGSVGVGPLSQTIFYQIPREQVVEIGAHLSPVVRYFRMNPKEKEFKSRLGVFDRIYPPKVS